MYQSWIYAHGFNGKQSKFDEDIIYKHNIFIEGSVLKQNCFS